MRPDPSSWKTYGSTDSPTLMRGEVVRLLFNALNAILHILLNASLGLGAQPVVYLCPLPVAAHHQVLWGKEAPASRYVQASHLLPQCRVL